MISKLIAISTLAALASAFTDFHALNPHHKQTELPDDRLYTTHDVHHVFPEQGTFFKAKYEAVHHKKWHFVQLDEHDVDFMKHVDCRTASNELHVKSPSKKLQAAVAKQNFEWTILTAHHKYHCSGTGIFRAVTGATYNEKADTLELSTLQLNYEDVFEHLDFHLETNHFEGQVHDTDEMTDDEKALLLPSEEEGHQMQQQGWFKRAWKKAKKAVKKVVQKAKKVVKKVIKKVTQVVKTVKDLISSDYTYGKSWKLVNLNYNKDVTKRFSKWNFLGAVKLAASANAQSTLVFKLQISKLKLMLVETYIAAAYKAGVRVQFSSKVQYDNEASKQISLINLNEISFSLLGIPVVISVTCPISAGYDIDVDGRVNFNFLLGASGNIKLGARYTRSRGFQVVNEKYLKPVRDFNPRYFRYEVGLQAHVLANFRAAVNFLGFVQAGVQVTAEGTLQKNSRCNVLLQMTMQPVISASAAIKIKIKKWTLLNKQYGPIVPYSSKVPIVNYCLPVRRKNSRFSILNRGNERHMIEQADDAGADAPVNTPGGQVEITLPNEIEENSTGTVWYGYSSSCVATTEYSKREVSFSMQFLPGNYTNSSNGAPSTEIIFTLSHNDTVAEADGGYMQTNIQKTYIMNNSIVAGFVGRMYLYAEEDPEDEYEGTVNATADPVKVDSYLNIRVKADDATEMYVSAPNMFCTTSEIKLVSAQYSDDNTTFTIFASGEGTEEQSLIDKLKAYAIYVPIICVVVIAVVVGAVLCTRSKRRAAVQGANWAKAPHDVEPIMASGGINDNDARVAAL